MLTGKLLQFRKVFAKSSLLAEELQILSKTKYPDNMQNVRMNWKVSEQSKKCPDNLENVYGFSKKSLDDREVCLDNLESFLMILKVYG